MEQKCDWNFYYYEYRLLWDERTSYLFLMLYRVWYDACLCCYCTHVTWHKGTQTDFLLVFSWAVQHVLFTVASCEIFTLIWRGILRRQCRTTGEHSCLFRSMELCSNNRSCLVLSGGAHRTRNSFKLRCHMFCSWGELQLLQPLY